MHHYGSSKHLSSKSLSMKKLIKLYNHSNQLIFHKNELKFSRISEWLSRTLTISAHSNSNNTITTFSSLYSRLAPVGDPRVSVVPILDQWVEEGHQIDPVGVHSIVSQLRKSKRFKHCLQIVQWMIDKRAVEPSPKDISMHLDLIFKVHGIEQAEDYFDSVPNTLRFWQVYNALMKCYAKVKLVEKAEATMMKMVGLGYAGRLTYNIMLNLYYQLGDREKLDLLVQEMEKKRISGDKYTYNIRLCAYGASNDIDKMDSLIMKMEADPRVTTDCISYTSAATGYIKAGDTDKAIEMLKKAEADLAIRVVEGFSYHSLITLYARIGKRDDVYRLWNLNKKPGRLYNSNYQAMINALCTLDDLDGAEKILEEWEATTKWFDMKVPTCLIKAYCKKGLLGKAELIVERLIESGKKSNAFVWSHLSFGYLKHNQMDKAVDALKKVILEIEPPQKLNISVLASCLDYLHDKEDTHAVLEIVKSLKEKGLFTKNLSDNLVNVMKENQIFSESLNMEGDSCSLEEEMTGKIESMDASVG